MIVEKLGEAIEKSIREDAKTVAKVPSSVVTHINQGQTYRIVVERSAVKGVDGFKVEANGDNLDDVELDVSRMYNFAKNATSTATTFPLKEKE